MVSNAMSGGSSNAVGGAGFSVSPPAVTLPKGGGAIRGIGEKFAARHMTGTGSMSIPIATSPGRAGFGPQLSLTYDSGAGNGVFGLGWHLSLPSITRKTDKGLPRYDDDAELDVFVMFGAEDLVPELKPGTAPGSWETDEHGNTIRNEEPRDGYLVQRYSPRVEGSFARIERWRNPADPGDVFWRSISRDNVTTLYGDTPNSRLFDPADPRRVFSWLISATYDDRGNEMRYAYRAEDDVNVDRAQASEANRVVGANRYLKSILYGNRVSRLVSPAPGQPTWLFEVVLDYGEHNDTDPKPGEIGRWECRPDPFSTYRPGFEVRTYRRCRRVLMFHHFPDEDLGRDCLVRSTDLVYREAANSTLSTLVSISQTGHERAAAGSGYEHKSLPPLELYYTEAAIDRTLHDIDAADLEGAPIGLGNDYQWLDLDGEGISGMLVERAGGWFYKRNLGPLATTSAVGSPPKPAFAPMQLVATRPAASLTGADAYHFVDLAGNGRPDLVRFTGAPAGFYQVSGRGGWDTFAPIRSLPNVRWDDPNLRFVDLTGDGLADVLLTAPGRFRWYESLGEEGFAAEAQHNPDDAEKGPRLVFADGEQAIYLADLSGDGLTDLVRIRNGEVCYWPNLGYGLFGSKVTMDGAPWFDRPDQFSQHRVRLADIDGSGLTDIVYLGCHTVSVYFNQAGNRWSAAQVIDEVPPIDDTTVVNVVDLLGNGTACLVWSSSLPSDARRPMRFIDLMGGQKPHLLTRVVNNLGAETRVQYAASTKFYLADEAAGRPWITKLPFPVHVVESVTVTDIWRQSAFTNTYSYHHGYFDGSEREFRGFARVEQVDVETFSTFAAEHRESPYITDDETLYQPGVKTVSWFHTGATVDDGRLVDRLETEFFPHWLDRLPVPATIDAVFTEKPIGGPQLAGDVVTADEWQQAIRACAGKLLRQEVHELAIGLPDASGGLPPVRLLSAVSQGYAIRRLQPKGINAHAVFLVEGSETVNYHYDLDVRVAESQPPAGRTLQPDPRISHTLNVRHDAMGNVEQSVTVGYRRTRTMLDETLTDEQRDLVRGMQSQQHVTYFETHYTDDIVDAGAEPRHRLRQPWEFVTYELTGISPGAGGYFEADDLRSYRLSDTLPGQGATDIADVPYHRPVIDPDVTTSTAVTATAVAGKRKIEHVVTLFFSDDLQRARGGGELHPVGLVYETYKLALTRSLLVDVLGTKFDARTENVLDTPRVSGYCSGVDIIGAAGVDQWWTRSGVAGFTADASSRFYMPEAYRDPYGNTTTVVTDEKYRLFVQSQIDALGNRTGIAEVGNPPRPRFDYRVLAPIEVEDANGNRAEVRFDRLGMVIAVAVKGKGGQADDLVGFTDAMANPDTADVLDLFELDDLTPEQVRTRLSPMLGRATTRHLYHFGEGFAGGQIEWNRRPAGSCSITRELHADALPAGASSSPIQVSFECSDGLGSVLMKRNQAEPGAGSAALRWIVNGKTVLNNKGNPVMQFEPYFSADATGGTGGFLPDEVGVTPLMYYDAVGRVVRTELADGTFSRVEFAPWRVANFDANDTVLSSLWYRDRGSPDSGAPLTTAASPGERAAWSAGQHAGTPSVSYLDSVGREAVVAVHNRFRDGNGANTDEHSHTFTRFDPESKPLWVRDARGNVVMRYTVPRADGDDPTISFCPAYDIAGNLLYQHSMDSGDRWMLVDAGGHLIRAWDENEAQNGNVLTLEQRMFEFEFDELRRPISEWLTVEGTPSVRVALIEYVDARDNDPTARPNNLQGQVVRRYDPSGLTETVSRDFNGNTTTERRCLNNAFTASLVDWQGDLSSLLEGESFVRVTEYDAMSRVTRLFNWHRGIGGRVSVVEPIYGPRGTLASETLTVRAMKTATGFVATPATSTTTALVEIRHDAKGQRLLLRRGNGTVTRYAYDPRSFRLLQVRTTRPGADLPFPATHSDLRDARVLQQLNFTYDPVGNVVESTDEAYAPQFFQNQRVLPRSLFEYDALYRLTSATGREGDAVAGSARGEYGRAFGVDLPVSAADPHALHNYTESYQYDAVGNITRITHDAGTASWTRFVDPAPDSNRVVRTWQGDRMWDSTAATNKVSYGYDSHGNTHNTAMVAPGQFIRWDHRDMISGIDLVGGGWAYYQYDAGKQRSRKRLVRNGGMVEEWIYLGGLDLYRRYSPARPDVPVEEIESIHLVEGEQRTLLVDDVITAADALNPRPDGLPVKAQTLFRYQYDNLVGTSCLELDDQAGIISYEEFHPYGTSAMRASKSGIEAPPKRYRFMGMERDEESHLSYHGARFYVPWLCRWLSPDPSGLADGVNLYRPFLSNPIALSDTSGRQTQADIKLPARLYRPGALLGVCRDRVPGASEQFVKPWDPADGPRMFAADPPWLQAMKGANAIFPTKYQNEAFESTIRGPVLGAAAPAVAVGLGGASIAGGTYYLGTGDYDKAKLAFSTALEVLPNVSPNFALSANQKMSMAIRQSQLTLEREFVMASLAEQSASHTIQPPALAVFGEARAAADEFASFALNRVSPRAGLGAVSAKQASRELGPVSTVVIDSRYPSIEVGLNVQRGRGLPPTAAEMQQLRESLHPILRKRLDALEAHLAEARRAGTMTNEMERAGVAGTHSEIVALNKAITAREAITNVSVTEKDLGDFVFVNRGLEGPFAGQNVPPPCYNCSFMIRGTTAGQ